MARNGALRSGTGRQQTAKRMFLYALSLLLILTCAFALETALEASLQLRSRLGSTISASSASMRSALLRSSSARAGGLLAHSARLPSHQPPSLSSNGRNHSIPGSKCNAHAHYDPSMQYRSLGHVGSLKPVDLEQPGALEHVASMRSFRNEIILFSTDATVQHQLAFNTVLTLRRRLQMEHYVALAPDGAVCKQLRSMMPDFACVFSSKLERDFNGYIVPSKLSFKLNTLRKLYVSRLAAMGYNVFAIDTDSAFFANPYPMLKAPSMRNYSLVVQSEGPCPLLNGGMMYVQNACEGSSAQWVLRGVTERIFQNIVRPERLNEHYPDLYNESMPLETKRKRISMCSDEQDALRDMAASAASDRDVFAYNLRASVPLSDRSRWWRTEHPQLACSRTVPVKPFRTACDQPARPGIAMELKRGRNDSSFEGEKLLSSPPFILGGVSCVLGYMNRCKPPAPRDEKRFQAPESGPAALAHFVGMARFSREIAMRALGTWNYDVFEELIPPDAGGVPEHKRPVLAIANPERLQLDSADGLQTLLARLYAIARLLGRYPAVPALKLSANEGKMPYLKFITVPDRDGSELFVWLGIGRGTPGKCLLREYVFPPDFERIIQRNEQQQQTREDEKNTISIRSAEQVENGNTHWDALLWQRRSADSGERALDVNNIRDQIAQKQLQSQQIVYLHFANQTRGAEALPRLVSNVDESEIGFLEKQQCHFRFPRNYVAPKHSPAPARR